MKRLWRIALVLAVILLPACKKRIVIGQGGISTEQDVMIAEAAENTRSMDEAGFSE